MPLYGNRPFPVEHCCPHCTDYYINWYFRFCYPTQVSWGFAGLTPPHNIGYVNAAQVTTGDHWYFWDAGIDFHTQLASFMINFTFDPAYEPFYSSATTRIARVGRFSGNNVYLYLPIGPLTYTMRVAPFPGGNSMAPKPAEATFTAVALTFSDLHLRLNIEDNCAATTTTVFNGIERRRFYWELYSTLSAPPASGFPIQTNVLIASTTQFSPWVGCDALPMVNPGAFFQPGITWTRSGVLNRFYYPCQAQAAISTNSTFTCP